MKFILPVIAQTNGGSDEDWEQLHFDSYDHWQQCLPIINYAFSCAREMPHLAKILLMGNSAMLHDPSMELAVLCLDSATVKMEFRDIEYDLRHLVLYRYHTIRYINMALPSARDCIIKTHGDLEYAVGMLAHPSF